MKSNFIYYKSKLDRYFNPDAQDEYMMSKSKIVSKMNDCNSIQELEVLIKNIKDEMEEEENLKSSPDRKKDIMEAMTEVSKVMKDSCTNLPKSVFHTTATFKEHFDKLEAQFTPYLDHFVDVDPNITQLSLA
mmetsp:Transcript_10266/g.8815  ORF Transcript_10266/g.8815 Transcript_10266/m.8815 type:complete len:132 (+) Transcript_10266:484-879(+)